jgi:hypothetical protein
MEGARIDLLSAKGVAGAAVPIVFGAVSKLNQLILFIISIAEEWWRPEKALKPIFYVHRES